jgi:predicted enzyme related to lactoylglutathione lyase
MLKDARVHPTLPAQDLDRAKSFYKGKLGLEPELETASGAFYSVGERTRFLLFPTQGIPSGAHTQVGFTVTDLESEVRALQANGVEFEEYDYPTLTTENGIAKTPVGKAAWFKDSEGNMIGLIEFDDPPD